MKRIIILLICALGATAVSAQTDSAKLFRSGTAETGAVEISRGESRGTAVFGLLGYEITLGGHAEPPKQPKVKFSVGINRTEVGFNTLSKPDYSRFDADQAGFLDLDTWRSWHVGISLIDVQVALNERRTVFFNAGMLFVMDTYFFSNNLILDNVDGKIVPRPLEGGQRNGQMNTIAASIPVRLDFAVWKKLVISGYASLDFIDASSRYRNRATQIHLPGVRPVTMSLGAMVTYDGLGFYVRYGVVPMFRSSADLVTRPLSFGVTIGF